MKRSHVGALIVCGMSVLASCHHGGTDESFFDLAGITFDFAGEDFSAVEDSDDFGTTPTDHEDPTSCNEASILRTYVGCDYWPTVSANVVWSVFDFAVVVSNPGNTTALVKVTGGALTTPISQNVAPGALVKIGLPWVPALKGTDATSSGGASAITASVRATNGAYHLVSNEPVLVYQFNALEYQPGTGNDLHGVPWSTCPASGIPCLSYSNDASLLLPSTALTPNYVITGVPGDSTSASPSTAIGSSYAVITATVDHTTVKVHLSSTGDILASKDTPVSIPAVAQNTTKPATASYTLDAGDVLQLVTTAGSSHDLTGSIIEATQPVQVLVGNPCTTNPASNGSGNYSCDHLEDSVLPIETWGQSYVVTAPSGPNVTTVEHTVRLYGGTVDASLTFTPSIPGAPTKLDAGAVYAFTTTTDFYVTGDHPFAVSTEQMSGQIVDAAHQSSANGPSGDPSLSFFSSVEQFRTKYLFLAPADYASNFVDVAIPMGATLTLDGAAIVTAPKPIGGGYGVLRLTLQPGLHTGAHTLVSSEPFGIQVMGYGSTTSYQYAGGLNLKVIASPPPPSD